MSKNEFSRSFEKASRIFNVISEAVIAEDGCDDDLMRLIKEPDLPKKVAKLLVKVWYGEIDVTIDYSKDFEKIEELKIIGDEGDNFSALLKLNSILSEKEGVEQVKLIHFKLPKEMPGEYLFEYLSERSLRIATIPELLAFRKTKHYKEHHKKALDHKFLALNQSDARRFVLAYLQYYDYSKNPVLRLKKYYGDAFLRQYLNSYCLYILCARD